MLFGENVTLRPWSENDLSTLQSIRNNVSLQRQLMSLPKGNSLDQIRDWLANKTKSADTLFLVISNKTFIHAIGYIHVTNIDFLNRVGQLGICIAPESQGKGYGSEAITLIENYVRDAFLLRKITLQVLSNNSAAIHIYTKLGYANVGCLRKHFYFVSELVDVFIMEKFIRS